MKLSRSVAIFAGVVLLTGGAAVAVNATTTNPIKMCVNNSTRVVEGPASSGACAAGTSTFYVARAADVQALANRLSASEAALQELRDADQALTARLDQLRIPSLTIVATENSTSSWRLTVTGSDLQADQAIWLYYKEWGVAKSSPFASVSRDGTVGSSANTLMPCLGISDIYVTSLTEDNDNISSEHVAKGPGCG